MSVTVFLRPTGGNKQTLPLEIDTTDTIAQIKVKIEQRYFEEFKFKAENINLLYQGRIVDDASVVDFSRETLVTLTFRNNLPSPAPVPAVPIMPVDNLFIAGAGEGIWVNMRNKGATPRVEDIFVDISSQTGKSWGNATLYSQSQEIDRKELLKSFYVRDNETLILSEHSNVPIPVTVTIPAVNSARTKKIFLEKNNFAFFVDKVQKVVEKINGHSLWELKDKQLISIIEYRTKKLHREYVNADLTFIPPFPLSSFDVVQVTLPDIPELRFDISQAEKWGFGKGIPIPVALIEKFVAELRTDGVIFQPFYLDDAQLDNLNLLYIWFDPKANNIATDRLKFLLRHLTVSVTNSTDAELIQLFDYSEEHQKTFCYNFQRSDRACFIYNYSSSAEFGKFLLTQSERIYARSNKVIFWRSVTFSSFETSNFCFSIVHSQDLFGTFFPILQMPNAVRIEKFTEQCQKHKISRSRVTIIRNGQERIVLFPIKIQYQLPQISPTIIWVSLETSMEDLTLYFQTHNNKSYFLSATKENILINDVEGKWKNGQQNQYKNSLIRRITGLSMEIDKLSISKIQFPVELKVYDSANYRIAQETHIFPLNAAIYKITDIFPGQCPPNDSLKLNFIFPILSDLPDGMSHRPISVGSSSFIINLTFQQYMMKFLVHNKNNYVVRCSTKHNLLENHFSIHEEAVAVPGGVSESFPIQIFIKYNSNIVKQASGSKLLFKNLTSNQFEDVIDSPIYISPDGDEIMFHIYKFGEFRVQQNPLDIQSVISELSRDKKHDKNWDRYGRDVYYPRGGIPYYPPVAFEGLAIQVDNFAAYDCSKSRLNGKKKSSACPAREAGDADWAVGFHGATIDRVLHFIHNSGSIHTDCSTRNHLLLNKSVAEVLSKFGVVNLPTHIANSKEVWNDGFFVSPSFIAACTYGNVFYNNTVWTDTRQITPEGKVIVTLLQYRVNPKYLTPVRSLNAATIENSKIRALVFNNTFPTNFDKNYAEETIEWRMTNPARDLVLYRVAYKQFANPAQFVAFLMNDGVVPK